MCSLNLYELRKEKGITQSHLAETLEVPSRPIRNWEMGLPNPEAKNLTALANSFDVPTIRFLDFHQFRTINI